MNYLNRKTAGASWVRRKFAVCFFLLLVSGVGHILPAQSDVSVQYFYDDVGRLSRVVDTNGNVATYYYDAVGNLLSITRSTLPSNNGLAILSFTPHQGLAGSSVTILG
jgi:YD repeat-containing protein